MIKASLGDQKRVVVGLRGRPSGRGEPFLLSHSLESISQHPGRHLVTPDQVSEEDNVKTSRGYGIVNRKNAFWHQLSPRRDDQNSENREDDATEQETLLGTRRNDKNNKNRPTTSPTHSPTYGPSVNPTMTPTTRGKKNKRNSTEPPTLKPSVKGADSPTVVVSSIRVESQTPTTSGEAVEETTDSPAGTVRLHTDSPTAVFPTTSFPIANELTESPTVPPSKAPTFPPTSQPRTRDPTKAPSSSPMQPQSSSPSSDKGFAPGTASPETSAPTSAPTSSPPTVASPTSNSTTNAKVSMESGDGEAAFWSTNFTSVELQHFDVHMLSISGLNETEILRTFEAYLLHKFQAAAKDDIAMENVTLTFLLSVYNIEQTEVYYRSEGLLFFDERLHMDRAMTWAQQREFLLDLSALQLFVEQNPILAANGVRVLDIELLGAQEEEEKEKEEVEEEEDGNENIPTNSMRDSDSQESSLDISMLATAIFAFFVAFASCIGAAVIVQTRRGHMNRRRNEITRQIEQQQSGQLCTRKDSAVLMYSSVAGGSSKADTTLSAPFSTEPDAGVGAATTISWGDVSLLGRKEAFNRSTRHSQYGSDAASF